MPKTIFSSAVRVTSKWLNGSRDIRFDGLDEDWHYPPLTVDSIQLTGEGGFDQDLVTVATPQTVSGSKVWTGSHSYSGSLDAAGQQTAWELAPDKEVYLIDNPDGVVTNGALQEYFSVIDGGDIG